MSNDLLDTRIRQNAVRLIRELQTSQAEVSRQATARGHRLSRYRLNHILQGRERASSKATAIAAGLGVDVSMLTMPCPAPADDSTGVQGADVQGAPVQESR